MRTRAVQPTRWISCTPVAALCLALVSSQCRLADASGSRGLGDAAVYRALIDSVYVNARMSFRATVEDVLLSEHLTPPEMDPDSARRSWLRDSVPGLPADVIDAYWALRHDTSPTPRFTLNRARLRIIPDSTLRRLFSRATDTHGGWVELRRAFPLARGIVFLSRVAFSRDGRWAIVYACQQSDALAGAGTLNVLRLDRGGWHLVRRLILWIS